MALSGWQSVNVNRVELHINKAEKVACITPKAGVRRCSRVSKEAGTFVLVPQPDDLPAGWEQAVAVNPDGKTGAFIYHNVDSDITQMADPRPSVPVGEDPLPCGWTMGRDDEGDVFYMDHNAGIVTYDDPRMEPLAETETLVPVRIKEPEQMSKGIVD